MFYLVFIHDTYQYFQTQELLREHSEELNINEPQADYEDENMNFQVSGVSFFKVIHWNVFYLKSLKIIVIFSRLKKSDLLKKMGIKFFTVHHLRMTLMVPMFLRLFNRIYFDLIYRCQFLYLLHLYLLNQIFTSPKTLGGTFITPFFQHGSLFWKYD